MGKVVVPSDSGVTEVHLLMLLVRGAILGLLHVLQLAETEGGVGEREGGEEEEEGEGANRVGARETRVSQGAAGGRRVTLPG